MITASTVSQVRQDTQDAPDTVPDTGERSELLDAVEWLRKAGVMKPERPAFVKFFEENAAPARPPKVPGRRQI